ncbi:DUF6368 family protein [Streptomyces sp. NPDC001732]
MPGGRTTTATSPSSRPRPSRGDPVLAALPERPNTSSMRVPLRLAMHRIRRRAPIHQALRDSPWAPDMSGPTLVIDLAEPVSPAALREFRALIVGLASRFDEMRPGYFDVNVPAERLGAPVGPNGRPEHSQEAPGDDAVAGAGAPPRRPVSGWRGGRAYRSRGSRSPTRCRTRQPP